MDDEDENLLREEWRLNRIKVMRKLFPNAPTKSVCRTCKGTFPNPILSGSGISVSMCYECRKPYLKVKSIRSRKIKDKELPKVSTEVTYEVKDLEEIKTLKDYLEMKI
tara:strand:- start:1228 stop:1551 length:324 start_codon:yes stop_codon:yes gene_type:complete